MTAKAPRVILPVPENGKPRPFWSVMIPAYQPDAEYLRQALESVLEQTPEDRHMQIEVVDDCSPGMDVTALVKAIAGDRVKVSQTPKNLGLAGCWNTCIERSRGEWVHILHQDDMVLPRFYSNFQSLFQSEPDLAAAFARYLLADADGHWHTISDLEIRKAGVLNGFDKTIATWQRIQCAAVVVKRSTYEQIGEYRTGMPFMLDWEMWCRIAAIGKWGFVPQLGAVYRIHSQSETERLKRSGETFSDILTGGKLARSHFSSNLQKQTESGFHNEFAKHLLSDASGLYASGQLKDAAQLLDSFWKDILKTKYRSDWFSLRLRILTKPLRQTFSLE